MKVRGTIKYIDLNSKKIKVSFHDVIKFSSDKIIFEDKEPEELSKWKDVLFEASDFDANLLYSFFENRQLLTFHIEENKITEMELMNE